MALAAAWVAIALAMGGVVADSRSPAPEGPAAATDGR